MLDNSGRQTQSVNPQILGEGGEFVSVPPSTPPDVSPSRGCSRSSLSDAVCTEVVLLSGWACPLALTGGRACISWHCVTALG